MMSVVDSETPCPGKLVDDPMSEIAVHLKFLKNCILLYQRSFCMQHYNQRVSYLYFSVSSTFMC